MNKKLKLLALAVSTLVAMACWSGGPVGGADFTRLSGPPAAHAAAKSWRQ